MLHNGDWWLVTDVARQSIVPKLKGEAVHFLDCLILLDCLTLKYGMMGCHETSVTINIRYVTFQKSADLMYTAAES